MDKILSPEEIDDWQENDFDWTNDEFERTNSISVEFKGDSFKSKFFLSSKSRDFNIIGQFKNNKIDLEIEKKWILLKFIEGFHSNYKNLNNCIFLNSNV